MKKLLEFIVQSLVDNPPKVKVNSKEKEGETILNFSVAQEDMGKVIGKGGKIIKSIRNLIRAKAIKEGKKVQIVLEEKVQKEKGLVLPEAGGKETEGRKLY